MARLVGIPYFYSPNAFTDQQADAAELRRAKLEKLEGGIEAEDDPYRLCQVKISHRIQEMFMGRVIRRTVTSRTPEGKPLIDLPPLTIINCILTLTDRELGVINSQTEANLDV